MITKHFPTAFTAVPNRLFKVLYINSLGCKRVGNNKKIVEFSLSMKKHRIKIKLCLLLH